MCRIRVESPTHFSNIGQKKLLQVWGVNVGRFLLVGTFLVNGFQVYMQDSLKG